MSAQPRLRYASYRDLDRLVALEERAFASDRFHRDQIEYLIEDAHGTTMILDVDGSVVGVAYMLWRHKSPVGRLYNIAVDPDMHGRGLGRLLLEECEREAGWRDCTQVSLEVRQDNQQAIRLYERHGYQASDTLPGYYEDGADGLRMTKTIDLHRPEEFRVRVPYHAQSLDFTCGPACLLMALEYFKPDFEIDRVLELNLWKESTLVFTTSGMGGTGPFGLALSAKQRDLSTRVILSKDQTPFFSSVRLPEKRKIIKLMHEDLRDRAYDSGIPISYYNFHFADIAVEMLRGRLPIVLISTYHLHGDRSPHWVVVTGFDKDHVYFHDPFLEEYGGNARRAHNVKIDRHLFSRMRRYGRDLYKSVVFVGHEDEIPITTA